MKKIDIIQSKSDAHRALICEALAENSCHIQCSADSKDIQATRKCLKALKEGREEMYCGESGSTLRFLLPVMGALGHKASFYPEGRLPQRPLSPLYEELTAHGCRLSPKGSVPLTIEGQLEPGIFNIPGNVSSQYISGLLFALPLLEDDSRIVISGKLESRAYVDMTIKALRDFGVKIEEDAEGFIIPGGQKYRAPKGYRVEGDWSNGCFFLAAGALLDEGICVSGLNLDSLQGDKEILSLLKEFGAEVEADEEEIRVCRGELKGIEIDASQIPDMVPILAVLACAAEGTTTIKNAGRLRIKECDRLAAVTKELNALGGEIEELPEGLIIHGRKRLVGGQADSWNDHRIAMMAAVASLICEDKVIIDGAEAVNKSYPDFFQVMKDAGLDQKIERK